MTAMASALLDTLDHEWLQVQLDAVGEDLFAVLRGQRSELSAVIELEDKRDEFVDNLTARLLSLPAEDPAELDLHPSDAEETARSIAAEIFPDQVVWAEVVDMSSTEPAAIAVVARPTFRTMTLLPYAVFLLLFWIFWKLAGQSRGMIWFGSSMLFSAVGFLLFFAVLRGATASEIARAPLENLDLNTMIFSGVRYTAVRIMTVPITLSLVAFAFIIGGYYLGRTSQTGS